MRGEDMKSVGGLDNSLFKTMSSKKTSKNQSAVRRKLERIKRKLRSGARLTAAEKEFLRRYAPGLYREAIAAEHQRAAYEARLKRCRTKEEAERVKTEKMMEMAARKDQDPETKMIHMAQTRAAEQAAAPSIRRKPSQVDLENKRRQVQRRQQKVRKEKEKEKQTRERHDRERMEEERWKDQYYESERILEKQQEAYLDKEAGIYKRPLRNTGEAAVQEEYEKKEAMIVGNVEMSGEHVAFARGHAAYQAAAQAGLGAADASGQTGGAPAASGGPEAETH